MSKVRFMVKILLWIIIPVLSIFFAIALLVRVPAIQSEIIQFTTTFVTRRTHTKIEVGKVGISFPNAIVVEALYIEDPQKDTLLYARKAIIDLAFYELLFHRITIHSVALEGATIKLYNTENDPLFNYNFLLTAFGDTLNPEKTDTVTTPKWKFSLKDVVLQDIRFTYQDEYAGMKVHLAIHRAVCGVDVIDPVRSIYQFGSAEVAGLAANVLQRNSLNSSEQSQNVSPRIEVSKLQLRNSSINYVDSFGALMVTAAINSCDLSNSSVDLQNQLLSLDALALTGSNIQYRIFTPELKQAERMLDSMDPPANNWKISAKKVQLKENYLAFQAGNDLSPKSIFDPAWVELFKVSLEASDFSTSADLTRVKVSQFSAIDQNNFAIHSLEADFNMDLHSLSAKSVKVSVANSAIEGNLRLEYPSLSAWMDSMQFSYIDLKVERSHFTNADLLYFKPDLINQTFFKHRQNVTTIAGEVTGMLKNLKGTNIVIETGLNTHLKTDFLIAGLPEVLSADYKFPNLKIISGKPDLSLFADTLLPQGITIPENFGLEVAFDGKIKAFESSVSLNSTFGDAVIHAVVDQDENFSGELSTNIFDLGKLLGDSLLYGPVTFRAEAVGRGWSSETMAAKVRLEASRFWLNSYSYHNLVLDGTIHGKEYGGKMSMKDENVVFDLEGLVNLNASREQLKFQLNVHGADLRKLQLTDQDLQIAFNASADIQTGLPDGPDKKAVMSGKAAITNVIVAHQEKKYLLDNFVALSVNEPEGDRAASPKGIVALQYNGTESPTGLPELAGRFLNNYFPFSAPNSMTKEAEPATFGFKVELHNHPILTEVFLPQLKEFEPGIIEGRFDSRKAELMMVGSIKKLVYGTTAFNDFAVNIHSDKLALHYQISMGEMANSQIVLQNISLGGKIADNKIEANLSSTNGKQFKKFQVKCLISKDNLNYRLTVDPKGFFLMNNRWEIAADNYISFGKQGLLVHHLFLKQESSQVEVASLHDRLNDDLNLKFKNFGLEEVSRIFEKDSSLVKGNVDGNILLKSVANGFGVVADAKISQLMVHSVPIGDLTIRASNPIADKFNFDIRLSGNDNNLIATGHFAPKGGTNSLRIQTDIQALSMQTVQALSMGQIIEAAGVMSGNFLVEGAVGTPELTGELLFDKVFVNPAFLNNRLELKHETIQLSKEGISFNQFTLLDKTQHRATIDGMIRMKQFSDLNFEIRFNTKDFLLFNTTSMQQQNFFGRMVVDSEIDLTGPLSLPIVKASVKMKKGSNFTFAVPDDKLSTDRGEGVVEFENASKLHPILNRGAKKGTKTSGLIGFDLSSVVEIDQEATLRLLMDPASTDSLVVRGSAALSFEMDRSGKMTLTGAYNLNDGSYLVSLESVIKKRFAIKAGSTIIWNGDPLEATISIDAVYSVRASPFDLVADQISGLSDVDQGGYKQRYPFLVLLKLRGEILHPEISFEIQLPPEEKGILGGAVNQKLGMLNEDDGALNKQVFALLVLGRFVQENPFQSESGGTSALIRTTVGKFLSAQLNQLSSKWLPGVELNFDIQSYDDYQSGAAKGRTEVAFGIKKQLFKERMSVQIGGAVDVEGERASQNGVNDLTSDVMLEYKLTKDGRFRLKGFRQSQYEGAIEGQLIETGIGVVYVKDFNRWDRLFRSYGSKKDSTITKNSHATLPKK